MEIVESIHHLVEIGSGNSFRKFAGIGNKIKEFTSSDVLEHDGEAIVGGLIFFFIGSVFPDADQFNQILVVEDLHDVELMFEGFKGGGLFFVLLDGDESALFIFTEFDSGLGEGYCAW